jgi:hypothetical protein
MRGYGPIECESRSVRSADSALLSCLQQTRAADVGLDRAAPQTIVPAIATIAVATTRLCPAA